MEKVGDCTLVKENELLYYNSIFIDNPIPILHILTDRKSLRSKVNRIEQQSTKKYLSYKIFKITLTVKITFLWYWRNIFYGFYVISTKICKLREIKIR